MMMMMMMMKMKKKKKKKNDDSMAMHSNCHVHSPWGSLEWFVSLSQQRCERDTSFSSVNC